jgi:hypothetical protein
MKKMLYWQIGIVLLVAITFHLSILLGADYKGALFSSAFAAAGAVAFGIVAIGSVLPEPSANPLLVKEALPNVCGLIAAASAAAMAFFFTEPYIGVVAAAISVPFAALAVVMAASVVQHVTEQGRHTHWRFIVSVLSLAAEVVLVALILQPVSV